MITHKIIRNYNNNLYSPNKWQT